MAGSTESISCRVNFCALGGESAVSIEDDVDDIFWILKVFSPHLATSFLVILLVLSLSCLREGWSIE
jgi:hypothetical protein